MTRIAGGLLRGAAHLLDLYPSPNNRSYLKARFASDAEAFRADAVKIRGDFDSAVGKVVGGEQAKQGTAAA